MRGFSTGFPRQKTLKCGKMICWQRWASAARHIGTVATYTAAGFVRRGLAAAGFTVARTQGFGRKRHMITACLGGRILTGQDNTRLGIFLMILVTIVFSVQDGISQHLASRYNVIMVVMIRYWFFAAFVIALAQRQPGGVRQVAVTSQLPLQIFRGVLLAVEICVTVVAFTLFGLVETHAVFVCYPLLVAAMSGTRSWVNMSVGGAGRRSGLVLLGC